MLSGLIPVLFSNNPKESKKALLKNLVFARKDLDRINRAFFIQRRSTWSLRSLKIIKKPRQGDAEFAFKERNLDRLFDPVAKGKLS
jgi:hypothetical protein